MSKKLLALVLALVFVLTTAPAFALELIPAGDTYPIATDATISFYAQDGLNPHDSYKDWTESPFHTNIAKVTGVKVDWMFPTTGADETAYTNTLLSDPTTLPNIMKVYFMNDAQDYLDRGIIWDLTDYLEEYAPAYWAYLQSHPVYDKALKTDNGQYYCFPFTREDGGWNDTYLGPVVRKDWLEEQGLDIPTTISEFEDVIRVFNDVYGAKFTFAWSRFNTTGISGAFGAYGSSNFQTFIKDGQVGLAQAEPEWREYAAWLHQMVEEGLLDTDSLAETDTTIKTKVYEDKIGISITSMGQMNNWNNDLVSAGKEPVWIGMQYPTSDEGELCMVFGGTGLGNATFVISKCTDEETMKLCLQFLDYAYTKEGFYFWNFGIQGETWDFTEDGEVDFLPAIKEANVGVSDFTVKYGGTTWSAGIQATKLLYLKNKQWSIDANDVWFYTNEDVTSAWKWPNGATLTVAETEEINNIKSQISTRGSEQFAAYLLGDADVTDDAVWDAYIADLETMGLDRMLELYQNCYDRYLAR